MSNYYVNPSDDVQQVSGGAITSSSTKVSGATAYGLNSVPSNSHITARVGLGDMGDGGNSGSRVLRGADVFSAYAEAGVTLTSVADNGSGKCRFTKTSHGYSVGDYVNITGSTSGNLDGTHKVTAVPTSATFDTDVAYVASATPGVAAKSAGRFADQEVDDYFFSGNSRDIAGGEATYGGYGDNSEKQAILKYNKINFGTDSAANPTSTVPGEFVFRTSGNPSSGAVQSDYPAAPY